MKDNSNQNGRPKGAKNLIDREAKAMFTETLGKHSESIDEAFQKLFEEDKTKFLEVFAKYASYFMPKKTEATERIDIASEQFDISKLYNNNTNQN